jgi:multisubunit Na+/H+ antiporter MnhE subunit
VGHPDVQHPRRLQVLGPEKNIHPGFIWLPLDIANIHGIAALTSMITLTPGTVSAALSDDRSSCWCMCCTWRTHRT